MNLRRTSAVTRKEFLTIIRDVRSLVMALGMPVLMLLLFGYALTLDLDRIPTLVYDANQSPQSRELIESFRGSRYFQIMGMVDDYRTMEARINDGRCLLGVAIPRDFSRKLLRGQEADVQLLFDGSDSNTASIALSYADVVVQTHSLELRNRWLEKLGGEALVMPVEPRLRVWYNHEMRSKNFIVPGLIAVILMTIAALLTSLTIAREWEMGTMEQLLSTPLRPAELVLGKMLSFFGIAVVDTVIAVLVGVCVFDVPFRGGWVFTGVTVFVFVFGSLCWGILLSALTRSQLMAFQAGMLSSFLPAFLLSGFIFDIGNMPAIVRAATYIFPTRYLVTVLKSAFLKGLGLEVLWMETVFLLLYAGLIFLLTTRKLRQKVA